MKRTNICTDRNILQKTAAAMIAAAATSTAKNMAIPMNILTSTPMTGNAPADMNTTTNTDIPTNILTSTPTTDSAPAAADMNTATNMAIPRPDILTSTPRRTVLCGCGHRHSLKVRAIPTSTPTAMDTTMPQAPPVRSM